MDSNILSKIIEARGKDPRKSMTVSDKLVKLQEEIGEIAAAHMQEKGFKPGGDMKEVRMNKKEEYADALIVLFETILADNFTFDEIKEEMHKGVDKWYKKILNTDKQDIVKITPPASRVFKMNQYVYERNFLKNKDYKTWIFFFYSDTCPPCVSTGKALDEFSMKYGKEFYVAKVDAKDSNCRALYGKYEAEKTPTIIMLQNGEEVERKTGMVADLIELEDMFKKYI